jgi:hypothetical protein
MARILLDLREACRRCEAAGPVLLGDLDGSPFWRRSPKPTAMALDLITGSRTIVRACWQTFPGLPEAADAVAAPLPNAQRHVLSGQDHGPTPEAIVAELVRFLRSIA